MTFTIAQNLDDALAALATGARPIAGGTDLVVGHRQGKSPLPGELVAIDRIEELARLQMDGPTIRIGSAVTHARLMADPDVGERLSALADASALVGSPATRNVGTLGGNVMNGSPAMDTGAPLMVLGAAAELRSTAGERTVALDELWTGPGTISAQPDELCTALVIEAPPEHSSSAYVRLEYRRAMEIAVVGAAAAVTLHGLRIASIRVALAAVAPTIVEVSGLEVIVEADDDVIDEAGYLRPETMTQIAALASEQSTPISDLRASDRYRSHVIGVMAGRAVEAAARRAKGEIIPIPVNRSLGIGAQR